MGDLTCRYGESGDQRSALGTAFSGLRVAEFGNGVAERAAGDVASADGGSGEYGGGGDANGSVSQVSHVNPECKSGSAEKIARTIWSSQTWCVLKG